MIYEYIVGMVVYGGLVDQNKFIRVSGRYGKSC